MMKQAIVLGLSLIPFVFSGAVALATRELLEPVPGLWRLVTIVLVWIVTFALGTQAFWKAVGVLTPE